MRHGGKTDSSDAAGRTNVRRATARALRAVERWFVGLFLRRKLFNPWFHSEAGIEFLQGMFARLKKAGRFSKATRRATFGFFVTQPLVLIPYKRWRFKRRHGYYPPGFLALSPTRRCNLACPGCFEGGNSTDELSLETVSRIVTDANGMGVYLFVLIGGEPLCWPPLFDLLERFPSCTFGIYTNGTLVTKAMADRFAALGNGQLGFSLEGFEEQTDRRRGAGVFRKVLESMDICRDAGVHFGYSVTVTRDNNDLVVSDEFVDLMMAHGCFDGWYYQYMPVGCAPDASLIPDPAQRERRRQRLAELRRTKDINLYDFVNDGPLVGGCLCAGRYYLHINAAGGVEPCAFYPFAADTIRDRTLVEVLESPFFKAIRAHQRETENLLAPCPVIDHPEWLREAVAAGNARPTQPTAALLLDGMATPLDANAAAYRAIADRVWKEELAR